MSTLARVVRATRWAFSTVALAAVFFFVVTPIALMLRLMGFDPLDCRTGSRSSFWTPYPRRQRDPSHYEQAF